MMQTKLNVYRTKDNNILLDTNNQLRQCPCPNCKTLIAKWYMKYGSTRWFNCPKCNSTFSTEPMLLVTNLF